MKKLISLLIVFTFVVGCLAACNKASGTPAPEAGPPAAAQESTASAQPDTAPADTKYTIAMIPKYKGINYFNACEKGAKEAAAELGIDLIWDGPNEARVDKQIEMIDAWIAQGVDAILVSPNDPTAIAPIMKKAMDAGICVMTWDADSDPEARHYFVNQASAEAIGAKLVDLMVEEAGPDAPVAIVTEGLTDSNQNMWIDGIKARIAELGVGMEIIKISPCDGDQMKAYTATQDILKTYKEVKGIWGLSSASGPGVAQAIRDAGRSGDVIVGAVATPSTLVEFLKDGTMLSNVLWNPVDLGYLSVYAAKDYLDGKVVDGGTIDGGKLGEKEVRGDEIMLGEPYVFTKDNIDNFDF